MSLTEGLASVLRDMTLGELALALAAILAYSLAINGSCSGAVRSGAASVAFAAAVGFTTLTPGWMSAVVFLALSVVAIAAFAGLAWSISTVLGLGASTATAAMEPAAAVIDGLASAPLAISPVRVFAPNTRAQPL